MEVSVISRRLRLTTLPETLIILDITKTESNNCFIRKNDKRIIAANTVYFAVGELGIALALRGQPTDYSD